MIYNIASKTHDCKCWIVILLLILYKIYKRNMLSDCFFSVPNEMTDNVNKNIMRYREDILYISVV